MTRVTNYIGLPRFAGQQTVAYPSSNRFADRTQRVPDQLSSDSKMLHLEWLWDAILAYVSLFLLSAPLDFST